MIISGNVYLIHTLAVCQRHVSYLCIQKPAYSITVFSDRSCLLQWLKDNCLSVLSHSIDFSMRNPPDQHLNNVMIKNAEIGPELYESFLLITLANLVVVFSSYAVFHVSKVQTACYGCFYPHLQYRPMKVPKLNIYIGYRWRQLEQFAIWVNYSLVDQFLVEIIF